MLAGLFALVQPQLFAVLMNVGIVLVVLALLALAGVLFSRFSRGRREKDAARFCTVIDLQTLAPPSPAPHSPPVVTVEPPKTSARSEVIPAPTTPSPRRITQEDLGAIDWFQFEKVMGLLYESRGSRVERRGGANPDGGIDLVIYKTDKRAAVQCKHWKAWKVGVRHFRDFFGGMKAEGFDRGIFVAFSGCTNEARGFARRNGIAILEASDIEDMLAQADAQTLAEIRRLIEDPTKHCPRCGAPMVICVAERGPHPGSRFWGCSTFGRTHCSGKIPIT